MCAVAYSLEFAKRRIANLKTLNHFDLKIFFVFFFYIKTSHREYGRKCSVNHATTKRGISNADIFIGAF